MGARWRIHCVVAWRMAEHVEVWRDVCRYYGRIQPQIRTWSTLLDDLIHVIYASKATVELDAGSLAEILRVSRVNNERVAVTGMLLHTHGSFFQVLEGPSARVDEVFSRIADDPRHRGVVTIIRERIHRRTFGEWSMGFTELKPGEIASVTGANDFFSGATCFDMLDAGRAKKLLSAFRDKRWRAA
jgi:hypothetical protein